MKHPLDHPAKSSISDMHAEFSRFYDGLMVYDSEYLLFGYPTNMMDFDQLMADFEYDNPYFYISCDGVPEGNNYSVEDRITCWQMVCETPVEPFDTTDIRLITSEYYQECVNLIQMLLPGYVRDRTLELGDYYGIWKNDKLIAATGTRLNTNIFSEVSGVVNHPEHQGKGHATKLIKNTTAKIQSENKTPYLHVLHSNRHAIEIYEKIGFKLRKTIDWWKIKPNNPHSVTHL